MLLMKRHYIKQNIINHPDEYLKALIHFMKYAKVPIH